MSSRCERLRHPRERSAAVGQSISVATSISTSEGGGVLKQRFSTKPATSSRALLSPSAISPLQELELLKTQGGVVRSTISQSWRPLFGAASLLGYGAVAVAAGLVAVASSETLAEATDGEDPFAKNSSKQDGKESDKANTKPPIVPNSKALRKRKTSNGRERFMISSAAVRGDRPKMEDTSFISDCKRFAAVYDGHGGAAVSEYLRKHYFSMLAPELAKLDEERAVANIDMLLSHAPTQMSPPPPAASADTPAATSFVKRSHILDVLKTSMEKLDAEIARKNEWKYQGSTAVGVLLYEDVIYTVNIGDCRAVMCRSGDAVELTRDHKPNDPSEQSRIESLGGTVKWHGYVDAQGEPIEPYGAYRINGNLAVARAIGDRDLRPFVSGEPEVKAFKRDEHRDEFIVIASDGLWDVFTSEEVVTFVKDVMSGELGGRESWRSGGHSDTRVPIFEWSQQYKSDRGMIKAARKRRKLQIANYLVQEALYRGTSDNVSVIVVWLR
ncbi:hypothetical protein Gpo141_00009127 [Globisporangium polare]